MDNPPKARDRPCGRDARALENPIRAHAAPASHFAELLRATAALGFPTMASPMVEAGYLTVSRCVRCGADDGSALARCRRCGSEEIERYDVPGRGRLVSWTVVRRPSGPFAHRDAFAVALVDLDSGLRLTGNLEGWEQEPPLGTAVRVAGEIDGIPLFAQEPP